MSESKVTISRPMVGLCALGCFLGFAVCRWIRPDLDPNELGQAGFLRVGLVMGALWLALPAGVRPAAWAGVTWTHLLTILFALFLVARFRQAVIPVLIAVITVGYYLRPRGKERPQRRPHS